MRAARLAAVREKMAQIGVHGWLSFSEADNFYLSGFTGDTSAVIITATEALLIVDPRFTEQAQAEAEACQVEEVRVAFYVSIGQILTRVARAGTVGFNAHGLTVGQLETLQGVFEGTLKSFPCIVAELRLVKEPEEVNFIRSASQLAEGVLLDALQTLTKGIAERELAAHIEYEFKKRGASSPAFHTIALFGPHSSLPHGQPGEKRLDQGDVVLIDMGCRKAGYCSDLTRTYSYDTIPGIWFDEIYQVVLAAQTAALAQLKAGSACRDLDAVARDVITEAGYGQYFGHGLGHGVGIEVHENPRLNSQSEAVLKAGMVVTVEPGIYLPGKGGVRIEDLVVVTETGCEVLTRTPKELKVLGR